MSGSVSCTADRAGPGPQDPTLTGLPFSANDLRFPRACPPHLCHTYDRRPYLGTSRSMPGHSRSSRHGLAHPPRHLPRRPQTRRPRWGGSLSRTRPTSSPGPWAGRTATRSAGVQTPCPGMPPRVIHSARPGGAGTVQFGRTAGPPRICVKYHSSAARSSLQRARDPLSSLTFAPG